VWRGIPHTEERDDDYLLCTNCESEEGDKALLDPTLQPHSKYIAKITEHSNDHFMEKASREVRMLHLMEKKTDSASVLLVAVPGSEQSMLAMLFAASVHQ
jgi:hypothetical protein